ncbi:hypothetical protein PIB30_061944 [Stylosanthes scabra]|uniref:Uncharacterized protein n=1 Tax=Stylosanthes scabra TaxID=79078 RepID=A0ABU6WKZ7_9FABA|nr:hypothetical protein [Stylosanthes scabra]
MLDFRNELDRVGFDDVRLPDLIKGSLFVWTPYMSPQWRDIEPGWVNEVGDIETWLATVPIVLFMYVRGEDKWWPAELDYWYDFWHNRRGREHQIQIVPTHYPGWPTKEYADWWVVACRRRFLSSDCLLQDPRGAQLLDDAPPAATQARDPIVLPRDAPARERRARMKRPDIRRKGEGVSTSGRSDA